MHVDGFRFDLASVLSRDAARAVRWPTRRCSGTSRRTRSLAGTKLIAEAWDAGGLYQVGSFVGDALGRVERPLPRRRPRLRQGRRRARSGACADRLLGSPDIYGHKQPRARAEHQLRHLPRRLHAQRPRLLQRQAQRGERRGQPRRQRRQPELELRRRGPDRRPGDRGAAQPPGQELPRRRPAVAGRADAARWATRSAARSAATTTPTARTTRPPGSTGRSWRSTPTSTAS